MLVPVPECTGTSVIFFDAYGKPVEVGNDGPMYKTAAACRPVLGELTFLPEPG
jgi:hypothetical protein